MPTWRSGSPTSASSPGGRERVPPIKRLMMAEKRPPHHSPSLPPVMTRRKRIIVALTKALVGFAIAMVCWTAFRLYRVVKVGIPEAYAAWTTADLIIDHVQTHDGAWPAGWTDLNLAARQRLQNGEALRCDPQDLPELVSVDWGFDPVAWMATNPQDTGFTARIVTRTDGGAFRTVWHGAEPNEMILEYLVTGKRRQ